MKNTTETLLGLILLILSVFLVVTVVRPINISLPSIPIKIEQEPVVFGEADSMNASCTASLVSISFGTVATGSHTALAENYAASYRRIQNVGNYQVFCVLDPATATLATNKGIVLNSSTTNSTYIIDGSNLYQKKINCIAHSSTGTISVMECY